MIEFSVIWLKRARPMFKRLKRWWRERQVLAACGSVCYCPKCREILNDIAACEEIEDGVYRYTCPYMPLRVPPGL